MGHRISVCELEHFAVCKRSDLAEFADQLLVFRCNRKRLATKSIKPAGISSGHAFRIVECPNRLGHGDCTR